MEAMSLGLPVIAADWGGPSDYVRPETGSLVGVGSRAELVEELAQAMRTLAEDGELRERLGQQGRAHAVAELDWSRRIDDLLALYQEIAPHLAIQPSPASALGPVLSLPRPTAEQDQDADSA